MRTSRFFPACFVLCVLLASARAEDGVITSCDGDVPEIESTLNSVNYFSSAFPTPAAALVVGAPVAIISANPKHLQDLLDHADAVTAYTAGGGWILLNGLTPDGLSEFDQLVGVPHILRKFRSERVSLAGLALPIARGLQGADVSMRTVTNPWVGDFIVASDAYGWVVDTDNLAPFAQLPDHSWFHHPDDLVDHNPANLVDGFYSDESWKRVLALYPSRSRMDFSLSLPKSMPIAAIDLCTSSIYPGITHVEFTFDGNQATKILQKTQVGGPNHVQLTPPITATTLTVRVVDWQDMGKDVIGIDEIIITPVRDQSFQDRVKPVTSIGAIVAYPRDKGGILLCQLTFPNVDQDYANQQRRRNILSTLMRNAGAAQGRHESDQLLVPPPPAIALGHPCPLGPQAMAQTTSPAWLDPTLPQPPWPQGLQSLGGIAFSLGDQPQVIVRRAGDPSAAIPIAQSARALIFLQLAATELADGGQVAHYTVVFNDGRRDQVPQYIGNDIANYRQQAPRPLCRAQVAWIGRNQEPAAPTVSVVYSRQWDNPTPLTPIDHVEVACDHPGSTFAVLGVTALVDDTSPGKP